MQRGVLSIVVVLVVALCAINAAAAIKPKKALASTADTTTLPLVSVIIPTHDRAQFLAQALLYIQRQDYPNVEVVIVDDSEVAQPELQREGITYIHLPQRASIGEKRNIAVKHAKGAIIAHWDDDDYFRSNRLSAQVAPILSGEVAMSVLEHHFYYVMSSRSYFTIKRPSSWGPHFGTFVYSRAIFQAGIRYPDNSLAEDYSFAELALNAGYKIRIMNNEDGKHVYVRHENTWQFNLEDYEAQVTKVDKPAFISEEDHQFLLNLKPSLPHSLPPNHFASEATQWDREELHPGMTMQELVGEILGATPKYPHYKKKDTGLSTAAKIGIGVGVAGGVVLIVVVGIAAYFFFQWQKRRYPGYTRINTEF